MKRKVRILLKNPEIEGDHEVAFNWETSKKGTTTDVLGYLIEKFQDPSIYPAGYKLRPITGGDRIELSLFEGPMKDMTFTYEMVSPYSYRQL